MAQLSVDKIRSLKLKWAFGFEGDVTAFGVPTVLGGLIFVGSAGGAVHLLDATTGCIQWLFQADGPVRAALSLPSERNTMVWLCSSGSDW